MQRFLSKGELCRKPAGRKTGRPQPARDPAWDAEAAGLKGIVSQTVCGQLLTGMVQGRVAI